MKSSDEKNIMVESDYAVFCSWLSLTIYSLFFFQKSYWPRGKILGGTSSINNLLYIRGSRHDYDEWAEKGCEGWSYEEVLPYFMKAENQKNGKYAKSGNVIDTIYECIVTPV